MSDETKEQNGSAAALLREVPAKVIVWFLLLGIFGLLVFISRDWQTRLGAAEAKITDGDRRTGLCEQAIQTMARQMERVEGKVDRLIERKSP